MDEIQISSNLNAKIINSITQFKKIKRIEVDKLDILIISYGFLNNKNYLDYCIDHNNTGNDDTFTISNYNWERVILDEGHEYINHSIVI